VVSRHAGRLATQGCALLDFSGLLSFEERLKPQTIVATTCTTYDALSEGSVSPDYRYLNANITCFLVLVFILNVFMITQTSYYLDEDSVCVPGSPLSLSL
jgi:hypothetical protein